MSCDKHFWDNFSKFLVFLVLSSNSLCSNIISTSSIMKHVQHSIKNAQPFLKLSPVGFNQIYCSILCDQIFFLSNSYLKIKKKSCLLFPMLWNKSSHSDHRCWKFTRLRSKETRMRLNTSSFNTNIFPQTVESITGSYAGMKREGEKYPRREISTRLQF